jgi:hypothetical protein
VRLNTSAASPSPAPRRALRSEQPPSLDSLEVLDESSEKEIYTNETIKVKSAIYIIRTCGWPASTTVEVRGETGSKAVEGQGKRWLSGSDPHAGCTRRRFVRCTSATQGTVRRPRTAACMASALAPLGTRTGYMPQPHPALRVALLRLRHERVCLPPRLLL